MFDFQSLNQRRRILEDEVQFLLSQTNITDWKRNEKQKYAFYGGDDDCVYHLTQWSSLLLPSAVWF